MPTVADVFGLRLHPDAAALKKDTEQALGRVDAGRAGQRAGQQYAAGLGRAAEGGWRGLSGRFQQWAGQSGTSAGQIAGSKFGTAWSGAALSVNKAMVRTVALGGAAATATAGVFAAKAVSEGLKYVSTLEQATIGFTTMLKSGQKATDMVGELQKFAARTPFQFPDLVLASERLIAMGIDAKNVIPYMTAIGDAAAGLGIGQEGINRITIALGQMTAKTRVQGDEMLQLTEAGVPALRILANAYGVSTKQMSDMITKGQVQASKAVPALIAGIEKGTKGAAGATTAFGGMMAKQATTLTGIWSNFKDNFNMLLGKLVKPAMPGIKKVLGDLTAMMASPQVVGMAEGLGRALGYVTEGVWNLAKMVLGHATDLKGFGDSMARWGASFLGWTTSKDARADVSKFLGFFQRIGPDVASIADSLGKLLPGAFGGLTAAGVTELRLLSDFLTVVAKLPPKWAAYAVEGFIGIGLALKTITALHGLAGILRMLTGLKGGKKMTLGITTSELAAGGMQKAADTMVVAAGAMQRAADTMALGITGLGKKVPVVGPVSTLGGAGTAAAGAAGGGLLASIKGAFSKIASGLLKGGLTAAIALPLEQVAESFITGKLGKTTAAEWAKAGTKMAAGAAIGFSMGGPWGAAIGAIGGALAALFTQPALRQSIASFWSTCYEGFMTWVASPLTAWFTQSLPDAFTRFIPTHVWSPVYEGFQRDFAGPMTAWFTQSLPHGFSVGWETVKGVFLGAWNWVYQNVLAKLITFFTSTIPLSFDIFKETVRLAWDKIAIFFLSGVANILHVMGLLPGPLGAPFRAAERDIKGTLGTLQADAANATQNIQRDFDKLHGKNLDLYLRLNVHGTGAVTANVQGGMAKVQGGGSLVFGAAGGLVRGGIRGLDSVLGMLMPGELIVPARMVRAGLVDHLRGMLPGFGAGGMVGAAGAAVKRLNDLAAQWTGRGQGWEARHGQAFQTSMTSRFAAAAVAAFQRSARAAAQAALAGALGGALGGGAIGRSVAAAKAYAWSVLGRYGWGQDQRGALDALWTGESGWRWNARNPFSGAYGIPQALPGSKMASAGADWLTNAATQIRWGLGYIRQRYGYPGNAYSLWLSRWPHWYEKGTRAARAGWAWVGERGRELIRLRGGEEIIPAHRAARYGMPRPPRGYAAGAGWRGDAGAAGRGAAGPLVRIDTVVVREQADIDLLAARLGLVVEAAGYR